jgi:hypothetical protein
VAMVPNTSDSDRLLRLRFQPSLATVGSWRATVGSCWDIVAMGQVRVLLEPWYTLHANNLQLHTIAD